VFKCNPRGSWVPLEFLFFFFFSFFWEGGFFGALFEVFEAIGPMIGEVGLPVVCTKVRCVRWGKKGQDSKKEREKWMGEVVGLQGEKAKKKGRGGVKKGC